MPRQTWLADVLRQAGCTVVEVDGWRTRGSDDFHPEGMTWHATAGSRTASAMAEVGVILHGSTSAPPPIAQLMLARDGTFYVCAAGRCNHNKTGWDGPNKGLGNTRLLGLEMANDNRGEPWPAAQLDAARRGTAAILRRLNVDPMRRLAAHYEHQPYATRPPGEGSTKSDPHGVDMRLERPRVAALMNGDDMSARDVIAALQSEEGQAAIYAAFNQDRVQRYDTSGVAIPRNPAKPGEETMTVVSALAYVGKDLQNVKRDLGALKGGVTQTNQGLVTVLGRVGATAEELSSFNARERDEVPVTLDQLRQLLDEAIPDTAGPLTPDEARAAVLGALRQAFAGPQS